MAIYNITDHTEFNFTLWSAGEVERITGMTQAQQRNLRRHGYIPKIEGHARFNIFDLTRLHVYQAFHEARIGPGDIQDVVGWISGALSIQILSNGKAIAGMRRGKEQKPKEWQHLEIIFDDLIERGHNYTAEKIKKEFAHPDQDTSSIARYVMKKFAQGDAATVARVQLTRFFVIYHDGGHEWVTDPAIVFEQSNADRVRRPVLFFDQHRVADALIERIGGTVLTVSNLEYLD